MAYISNVPIGSVAYASVGTNTTDIAGQLWLTDVIAPNDYVCTSIGFLQGGTATTDNVLVAIFDGGGNRLATSNLAGVTLATANTFAERTLLTPVQLKAGGKYYVALQGNGTAAGAIQTIPTLTFVGVNAGVLAGAFGTVPANIVVPQTFTAGSGPFVYLK